MKSRIVGVTVYREGARVHRIAEVSKEDGSGHDGPDGPDRQADPASPAGSSSKPGGGHYPGSLCITGLPLALDDASVRVSVTALDSASSQVAPIAADLRVTLDVPESNEDLAPPRDEELEQATRTVTELDARIAQVKRELGNLGRLAIAPRARLTTTDGTDNLPPSPLEARLALLEFRDQRERALRDELRGLLQEYRVASRRAKKLADRHQRASSARQAFEHELRKAVIVSLRPPAGSAAAAADPGAGPVDGTGLADRIAVSLYYRVPGARWAPAYSVRLVPDGQASFAMRAVVAQQTGEDWRGVALALSTADALGWAELPELSSIRIGRRQPRSHRVGWRPPPVGAHLLYEDYDRSFRVGPGAAGPGRADLGEDSREITMPMQAYGGADLDALVVSDELGGMEMPDESYDMLESRSKDSEVTGAHPVVRRSPPAARNARAQPAVPSPPPAMASYAPRAPGPAAPARRRGLFGVGASMGRASKETAEMPPHAMSAMVQSARSGIAANGMADFDEMVTAPGAAGGSDGASFLLPEPEPELVAGAEHLAYSYLRMAPPQSTRRGNLRPAGPTEIYLDLLLRQRIEVTVDVVSVITQAMRRAQSVGQAPLPPRFRPIYDDYYDYVYTADAAADVPSDGIFHSIPLSMRQASTRTRHVVVPRESSDVFRVAEIANPLGSPILAGPIDVYLDRDFLMTSDTSSTPAGGTLRLGLGVDQAVKVSRNTSYREETAGLMRGSLSLKHKIRIEIENHAGHAIDCEVRERIPAIRDEEEDIEITVERVNPAWQPYKPDLAESPAEADLRGGHAWRLQVPNGQKKTLEADYAIKISAKHELVGGNRREA